MIRVGRAVVGLIFLELSLGVWLFQKKEFDRGLRCLNTVCTRSTICTADVNKRACIRL